MPVNFQQAQQQIRQMGQQAAQQQKELADLIAQTQSLLSQYGSQLDSLESLVNQAATDNPNLRCAAPFHENLTTSFPEPSIDHRYTILAADGSQINPDRHAMVEFGAINVGAICMRPGNGKAAQEHVISKLMFHQDLFTANGDFLTDDLVALKRDLAERKALADLAKQEAGPVVALTDGPLELYGETKGNKEFEQDIQHYQQVLGELAGLGAAAAGYVDRPRGDLLVRLLELVALQKRGQINHAGIDRPFLGVYDYHLFADLQTGHRSAVFAIQSGAAHRFKGDLALHFFYLNVGYQDHDYLSRVEIPFWVANNEALLNLTHACLLAQSRHMGPSPYPYLLHRAHEIAVVSFDERDQLQNMIVAEMRRQGADVANYSNKQIAKRASSQRSR